MHSLIIVRLLKSLNAIVQAYITILFYTNCLNLKLCNIITHCQKISIIHTVFRIDLLIARLEKSPRYKSHLSVLLDARGRKPTAQASTPKNHHLRL